MDHSYISLVHRFQVYDLRQNVALVVGGFPLPRLVDCKAAHAASGSRSEPDVATYRDMEVLYELMQQIS